MDLKICFKLILSEGGCYKGQVCFKLILCKDGCYNGSMFLTDIM